MKTLRKIGEFGLIRQIRKKVKYSKSVQIGIGDDAALVRNASKSTLITTDLLIEGVDFSFDSATPEEVGRKALAVNLSDIAAMGGIPTFAVLGLGFPADTPLKTVQRFQKGLLKIARRFGVQVVGGDLSKAPRWMISVSLLGCPDSKVVTRTGAKPGDLIYVTGALGGSILRKHLKFDPRVREGQFLARAGATAMIDISDGLLQDLRHILEESNVGAQIDLDAIPVSQDARRLCKKHSRKALRHALSDGEDFELLFTISPSRASQLESCWKKKFTIPLVRIGTVRRGPETVHFQRNGKEARLDLHKKGFTHF